MAKVMAVGTYASDDPTRAALPFLSAKGSIENGEAAEVFLLGEAVYLMKDEIANACDPVGWPNVGGLIKDLVAQGVTFYI